MCVFQTSHSITQGSQRPVTLYFEYVAAKILWQLQLRIETHKVWVRRVRMTFQSKGAQQNMKLHLNFLLRILLCGSSPYKILLDAIPFSFFFKTPQEIKPFQMTFGATSSNRTCLCAGLSKVVCVPNS